MKDDNKRIPFFTDKEIKARDREWRGMPEFIQRNREPYQTIKVHFICQEDVDRFNKLIQQKVTPRTKFIWFPKLKNMNLLGRGCVDKDES